MSTEYLIWAISIYTGAELLGDHAAYGIYSVDDKAVLRHADASLSGFNSDMITDISSIVHGLDLRSGGGISESGGVRIVYSNAGGLYQKLIDLDISLHGATVKIVEHDITEATQEQIHEGTIEDVSWNDIQIQINSNVTFRDKRRVDIAAPGIPVTFGESDPENGRFFKLLRTSDIEKVYKVEDIAQFEGEYYPPKMSLFPVWIEDVENNNSYVVRIGALDALAYDGKREALEGMFLKIVESVSENVGLYRKIINTGGASLTGDEKAIRFYLRDFLPRDLEGNETGTAEEQAWVEVVEIDRTYTGEVAECDGFYIDEVKQDADADVYVKSENEIIRIPPYGVNIDVVKNNQLNIDPLHIKDGPANLVSQFVIPVQSISRFDTDDLEPFSEQTKRDTGIYGDVDIIHSHTFTNPEHAIDKKHDTYCEWNLDVEQTASADFYTKALKIVLPEPPPGLHFTKTYLGVKMWSRCDLRANLLWGEDNLEIKRCGYINRVKDILVGRGFREIEAGGAIVDNLPDFYYFPKIDTANRNFYRTEEKAGEPNDFNLISGYYNFELSDNKEDYLNIEEVALMLGRFIPVGGGGEPNRNDDLTKIYQVAVIFEASGIAEAEIYV